MISLEMMPPIMFAGLIVFMLIGYPVAFTLSALGLLCGFVAVELGFFPPEFLQAIPSRIFGQLQSNGRIFLLNANGVLFGSSARIEVGGLVASSLSLSNGDFLAGR